MSPVSGSDDDVPRRNRGKSFSCVPTRSSQPLRHDQSGPFRHRRPYDPAPVRVRLGSRRRWAARTATQRRERLRPGTGLCRPVQVPDLVVGRDAERFGGGAGVRGHHPDRLAHAVITVWSRVSERCGSGPSNDRISLFLPNAAGDHDTPGVDDLAYRSAYSPVNGFPRRGMHRIPASNRDARDDGSPSDHRGMTWRPSVPSRTASVLASVNSVKPSAGHRKRSPIGPESVPDR